MRPTSWSNCVWSAMRDGANGAQRAAWAAGTGAMCLLPLLVQHTPAQNSAFHLPMACRLPPRHNPARPAPHGLPAPAGGPRTALDLGLQPAVDIGLLPVGLLQHLDVRLHILQLLPLRHQAGGRATRVSGWGSLVGHGPWARAASGCQATGRGGCSQPPRRLGLVWQVGRSKAAPDLTVKPSPPAPLT